jgi:glycosyltransferase involved in cell wall biosynthesis
MAAVLPLAGIRCPRLFPEPVTTKLIIQIPCYNEAQTLPLTLAALPRSLPGVASVEWLVIDDGSEDDTAQVAQACGVDHIVRLPQNQGLANAFVVGLDAALRAGADIIVNTDADNQYCADDIPRLLQPILEGKAEIVIGERPIASTPHFSPTKKALQRLGSLVVRKLSDTEVADAPSGFRAMSRDAAMRLHVFNEYSYTLETIIQAGRKGMAITSVPIRTNAVLRPSRLFRSNLHYIRRQGLTLLRIFMTYNPFFFFAAPGLLGFLLGFLIGVRFLYYFALGAGTGHVQSLILAALLMGSGFGLIVVGLVADLISVNRKLLEKLDWKVQVIERSLANSEGVR